MGTEADKRGNMPIFESLEPRLLLSSTFDLDGDTFIAAGDDAIFSPAWQTRGRYAFSDALLQPGDTPDWDARCDFDGDFHVGSGDYAWLSTNWGLGAGDPMLYPDDPHDDDQYTDDAFAKGAFPENGWFSDEYGSMAIAGDDDWFYINVPADRPIVNVDCRFLNAEGNIDVKLYAVGGPIATADSTTDNESIQMLVDSPGMHYLKVYSPDGPSGQRYDLRWWADPIPDVHEEDDSLAEADALGPYPEEQWFSEQYGHQARQYDRDYFAIDVPADKLYVTIDATFNEAEGLIYMDLLDADGDLVEEVWGPGGGWWHIDSSLNDWGPGRYYISIQGPNNGQFYDLKWDAQIMDFRAVDDTATVPEDSINNEFDVLVNDIGSDLSIVDVAGGWTDGDYVYYSPQPDRVGTGYVSYSIQSGGAGNSDWATVTVTITPMPDPPVAGDDVAGVDEDSVNNAITVLTNDSDPDGDPLTVIDAVVVSGTPIGSVTHDTTRLYYTPDPDKTGTELIEYTIDDGTGRTDSAYVTVDVGGSPDDPVAEDDFFAFVTGMHKNTLHVMDNDWDPDGDSFTIIDFPDLPDDGDVTTDGLIVEFEPDEGFIGFDSFEYTIQDSTGRMDTALVDVQVLPTSDIHEEDDTRAQADALGVSPKMVAPSSLLDEDYYMIEILPGFDSRMTAELWGGADMDMELLDADGVLVASSFMAGPGTDRFIDTTAVSPGKYYVRVFSTGIYWGEGYVFQWDSFGPSDPHEPDNTYVGADALGALTGGVTTGGISNDQDYYRFEVQPGLGAITAELTYDTVEGNLDIEISDEYGLVVAGSYSTWFNRDVIERVVEPGPYYLRVFSPGGYTGQEYELAWYRVTTEDNHEEDDNLAQADAHGALWEDYSYYSQYSRLATQTDDDYFRIDARSGYLDLDIDCWFSDGEGDIDLYLLDDSGVEVAASTTWTSNEHIDYLAPAPGAYYIKVTTYGTMSGLQTYDLRWEGNRSDDTHEEDDYRIRSNEKGPFAANTWHDGTSWDPDAYLIEVPVGHLQLEVDCRFTHAEGDINVYVRGDDFLPLPGGAGESTTDNEFLTVTPPGAGTYYIYVEAASGYTGQDYDLLWMPIASEDAHEEDDSRTQADARGPFAQNQPFTGQQWDDDIFRLDVPQGYENVTIDCTFDSAEGDIDILLVDAGATPVAASTGLSDGEHIDTVVPSDGTYYVYVYDGSGGYGTGQQYRLRWSAVAIEDSHENDNTFALADQKGDFAEGVWFNGRVWNDDYYRINVPSGSQRVDIDCLFTHAEGNVTLVLYDDDENVIDISNNLSDNEYIDLIVPDTGTYYIKVLSANQVPGQEYQLRWNARSDDAHEIDDNRTGADLRGTMYSGSRVKGIARNNDYYRIEVFPGRETVWAICEFSHAEGDLDLYLHDSSGQIVADSNGTTDTEEIWTSVPAPGTYYLRIDPFSGSTGQVYELYWTGAPSSQHSWTVMTYMDGDNNLESPVQAIINDMVAANMPAGLPVTMLADGFDGTHMPAATTQRGLVGGTLTDLGELNMGDPDTLGDFIDWSMENYPAEHYALILMDHGSGMGCCSDDTDGDGLSMPDIKEVLSTRPNLDILMFTACVMGTVNVSYQLVDEVTYVIASEANMAYPGVPMTPWLTELKDNPNISPLNLAKAADQVYEDYCLAVGKRSWTLSTIQTNQLPSLVEALDDFADAVLAGASNDDWIIIQNAKFTGQSFGSYRDLGNFMDLLVGSAGLDAAIRGAAQDVLNELATAIATNYYGPDTYGTGLTVYAPDGIFVSPTFNDDLFFVRDTDWEDFLRDVPGDSHEADDSFTLGSWRTFLGANTNFPGTYYNEDYFRISPSAGLERVTITLDFVHAEGDLDLELYDVDRELLASSSSVSNDESIVFTVPASGTHFIRVVTKDGLATGQSYTLSWSGAAPGGSPQGAAGSPAPPVDVLDVEYVLLPAPSAIDTLPGLPTSLTEVEVGDTFYLEAWMQNRGGSAGGIIGGYLDIWYDDLTLTAGAVSNGGIYTNHAVALSAPASIHVGGMADQGVTDLGDDEWVRLGYAELTANVPVPCMFMTSGGMDHFARANEGKISWWNVERDNPPTELNVTQPPPELTVDLQAGSDTGASDSDNVTNNNIPVFDVTVNMPGDIYIDYEGDEECDEVRWVDEPGTYEFTPSEPLADGHYPVLVEFDVPGLGTDSDNDPTIVGTARPEANLAHPFDGESISDITINVHEPYIDVAFFDLNGNGMDAITIIDGAQEFTLSGAAAAGVAVNGMPMSIGGGTYRYFFTGNFVAGAVGVDFTAGSFADIAGNTNDAWGEGFTVAVGQTSVVARHVFCNNSAWDGNDPDANVADDAAIAWEKAALLPGQTASFANYTGYWRGINGIMVDINHIPGALTDADFGIRVNDMNPDAWSTGPTPDVTVRPGGGLGASDRVTLIWGDSDILNRWVEVTVLAGANTGLAADDVFQFANIVGDCEGNGEVGSSDYGTFGGEFGLRPGVSGLPADFNADGRVDLMDFAILRDSFGNTLPAPAPAVAPEASPAAPVAALQAAGEPIAAAAAPVVPVVSQPLDDLLVESPSLAGYISGPQPISAGSSAIKLYRAAMREYDLRPLDDLATDGQDDLLADILAESPLAVPL